MHVAINGWFWDQINVGSGQYLRRLLHAIRRQDKQIELTLVMPPHNPNPDDLPPNVNVYQTGQTARTSKFGKVWFEQRTFPAAVGSIKPDVAHVPYWGGPLACPAPLVTSVLDVIPLTDPLYSMGFFNRLYTTLVSTAARNSDHIITISEAAKLDIEYWLDIPTNHISVTYLAPDEMYHPQIGRDKDEAVRQKYNLPDDYVLYLGGFDRRKRVMDLLTAYVFVSEAHSANLPLVIAGRIPDPNPPLFPDVRGYAHELELDDLVQWIGYVDEADKPALYRMARVFVFPSENEGFGLPPLEAMASGTPVVASDAVIFDETLEEAAYLVSNPRDMAAAVIALIVQEPFHEAMRNQGLAQATKFSWRKTAKKTLDIYARVMQAK